MSAYTSRNSTNSVVLMLLLLDPSFISSLYNIIMEASSYQNVFGLIGLYTEWR